MPGSSLTPSDEARRPPALGDDEAADALERTGRGDRAALMSLYDRYGSTLLAVASRITSSRAEAEEVLQDAMVRAWIEAPTYDRARGSAIAWLVTLTRNRAIDVVRSRGRRTAHETESGDGPADPPPTPERAVSEAERAQAVRAALATLTKDQRKALDLAYFGGLSHSEIAEKLRQPLGTIKTRIAQAVRRLRDALAHHGPNGRPSQ
jgi:RNA polymerase sigma-70 factor (ECF subfamily)